MHRDSSLHWPNRKVSDKEVEVFLNIIYSILPRNIVSGVRSSVPTLSVLNGRTSDNSSLITKSRSSLDETKTYIVDVKATPQGYQIIDDI